MNDRNPPRLAVWLLDRWAADPKHESLVGDLTERYRHGRSSTWYWRQAIRVVLARAHADVRDNPLLTVRAVMVGLSLYFVAAFPVSWIASSVPGIRVGALVEFQNWLLEHGHDSLRAWTFQIPLISLLLFQQTLVLTASAFSGWVVARLHSRYTAGMVFAFGMSVALLEMAEVSVRLGLDGGRHPVTLQTIFVPTVFLVAGRPMFILLGGVLGTRRDGAAPAA